MTLTFDTFAKEYRLTMHHSLSHTTPLGTDIRGNITRIDNLLEGLEKQLQMTTERLETTKSQQVDAEKQSKRVFPQEDELKIKTARLNELNARLNMDEKDSTILDEQDEVEEPEKTNERTR